MVCNKKCIIQFMGVDSFYKYQKLLIHITNEKFYYFNQYFGDLFLENIISRRTQTAEETITHINYYKKISH